MSKTVELLSKMLEDNFNEKELVELIDLIPEITNVFISLSHKECNVKHR